MTWRLVAWQNDGMHNRLVEILLTLARSDVRFVVAGGIAALLHGVERVTLDLGIAIDMEPENVQRFLGVVEGLRLTPRAPVRASVLADPVARRGMVRDKQAVVFTFLDADDPLWQVDVFLTDDLSYERLMRGSKAVTVGGHDLEACRAADFDGHTSFADLSAEQRLDWADRSARLLLELRGLAAGVGGVSREARDPTRG